MVWKLKGTIETRKRNNQSKNKFPNYKKDTDLFKNTQKSLKLFVEFSTKVEIYSHIQWENAVDRSSG
jgi:hypothetical protein